MNAPLRIRQTHRPILYELDTRSWLNRLSHEYGRRIQLGNVPQEALEPILRTGCDLVWLMGVWRTGPAGRSAARREAWLEATARAILPDFAPNDIVGSPYAVAAWEISPVVGGEEGLARFRRQLAEAGVGIVLDFVPNHTALDHPWVRRHPEWYVHVDPDHVEGESSLVVRAGGRVHRLAHGRDPNFPAWRDTAQLDYRIPAVRDAMADVLGQVASRCDGIRCDMAILVLEDVFRATWQGRSVPPPADDSPAGEFWWHAIRAVRDRYPDVVLIAEAYWGLEYRLQQLGFDYTYDKTLLDRLRSGPAEEVAAHLRADIEFQRRLVRFLENHDEERVATALPPARQRSAAVVVATVPGMLLLHDGQLDGARIRTPVQLARRPAEPPNGEIRAFYDRLLGAVTGEAFRRGTPVRLEPQATWEGDPSHRGFVAWLWMGPRRSLRLAVANLGPSTGRCFLPLCVPDFAGRTIVFEDLLGEARYERDGGDLLERGLYLELPADGYHLFRITGHRSVDDDPRPGASASRS
ncbi:MAG TPA: alpha-amylase family glycosyl hydrolase [Candidatus Binatia bacterium]|nr:alpha-amylase family glycosyl hydrolase [Candidatus Binatia bacterium]